MTEKSKYPEQEKVWTEWFEIPVTDFVRAKKFYETIFDINIEAIDFGGLQMGIFPHTKVGCAICKGEAYTPAKDGFLVLMNANPDLQVILDKVEAAGAKIIRPKSLISPEHGFNAMFIDTEGNRVGIHSKS